MSDLEEDDEYVEYDWESLHDNCHWCGTCHDDCQECVREGVDRSE